MIAKGEANPQRGGGCLFLGGGMVVQPATRGGVVIGERGVRRCVSAHNPQSVCAVWHVGVIYINRHPEEVQPRGC